MSVRDALHSLSDNPLFRRECRLQRISWGWLLMGGIASCCGLGFFLPFLVAPALAASAIARERRAGTWNDLTITRLTRDEVLLAKLLPALRLPAALLLIGAASGLLSGLLRSTMGHFGSVADALSVTSDLLLPAPAALVVGVPALLLAGVAGLWAGLRFRESAAAVVVAYALFAAGEVVCFLGGIASRPLSAAAWMLPNIPVLSLWMDALAHYALYYLCHLLLLAGLWSACRRAV